MSFYHAGYPISAQLLRSPLGKNPNPTYPCLENVFQIDRVTQRIISTSNEWLEETNQ
jgi:hypothetical protein